jgi:Mechanosensitive ion channel/Conserved TM helix
MDTNIVGKALEQVIYKFFNVIPGLVSAIVILIVGVIFSRFLRKLLQGVLSKTGIDLLGEKINEIDIVRESNIKIVPSVVFSKTIFYLLLLVFIIAATDALGMESISQLVMDIVNYVPSLITAILVLAIGVFFADSVKGAVLTTCQSMGIPSGKIIANFVFYFIFINAVVTALGQAKIDTDFIKSNLTVLLGAVASAFALGYGIASKDLMASFLASFYSRDRYEVGDKIAIDGVSGTIIEMDNTAVVIQAEGKKVVIPMSKLTNEKVEILD